MKPSTCSSGSEQTHSAFRTGGISPNDIIGSSGLAANDIKTLQSLGMDPYAS